MFIYSKYLLVLYFISATAESDIFQIGFKLPNKMSINCAYKLNSRLSKTVCSTETTSCDLFHVSVMRLLLLVTQVRHSLPHREYAVMIKKIVVMIFSY